MLDFIVMQMRRVNREKGYFRAADERWEHSVKRSACYLLPRGLLSVLFVRPFEVRGAEGMLILYHRSVAEHKK